MTAAHTLQTAACVTVALTHCKPQLGCTPHDLSIVNKKYKCAEILLTLANDLKAAEKAEEERLRAEQEKKLAAQEAKHDAERLKMNQRREEKRKKQEMLVAEQKRKKEEELKRRELWGV